MTSRIRDKVLRFRGFETKKLVVHVQENSTRWAIMDGNC